MAEGKTIRELAENDTPSLDRLIATQDATSGVMTKSTLQQVFDQQSANEATLRGRAAGAGAGALADLTATQVRTILNIEDGAAAALAQASGAEIEAGTETELRAYSPADVKYAIDYHAGSNPPASAVAFTPTGNIAATTVQTALAEVDSEKAPTSRTITAGSGLSGGGALASDLALSVNFAGSGAAATVARSDHTHDVATTSSPGFMSPAAVSLLESLIQGTVKAQDDVANEEGEGEEPETIPLALDPATDASGYEVASYDFTETLTGDLDIILSTTGQRNGHRVRIHRSGDNDSFAFTITSLVGVSPSISLDQGETAELEFDGSGWTSRGVIGQTPGGISTFEQAVEVILASTSLTAARQMYGVSGGAARHLTLLVKPSTGSTNVVLTLPDAAPIGFWYIVRDPTHTGSLTIVNETSGGSLNGNAGGTVTVATQARSAALVQVYEQAGSTAVAKVVGETTEDVVMPGLLTVTSVLGTPVTSVSGSMTVAAHSGRVCVISGNVTVPVTNGFTATIISTGSYTVGAGGATTALASGEAIAVMVAGGVVYRSPVTALTVMPQS